MGWESGQQSYACHFARTAVGIKHYIVWFYWGIVGYRFTFNTFDSDEVSDGDGAAFDNNISAGLVESSAYAVIIRLSVGIKFARTFNG